MEKLWDSCIICRGYIMALIWTVEDDESIAALIVNIIKKQGTSEHFGMG